MKQNTLTKKNIYKIKTTLYNPNITEKQLRTLEQTLRHNLAYQKDINLLTNLHITLGTLYLITKDIHLAKEQFESAKQLNTKKATIYHNLFKIDIHEKNYQSAKKNLEICLSLNNYKKFNLDLYKLLLDKLLNQEQHYNIDDFYFNEQLNGKNLILYLTAIKFILDENYQEAKQTFEILNNKIKLENIPLDFSYVIMLINELNKRKIDTEKKESINQKLSLLKDYIWNTEIKNINKTIKEITEERLNSNQIIELLHEIPNLLDIDDYTNATYINEWVKKKDKFNNYSRMTSFYDRLIAELKTIYELKDEKKEMFQTSLQKGLENIHLANYTQALNFFTFGLKHTNIKLFHYYIGKMLYKLHCFEQAQKELNLYNQDGAYKIFNCKHYLSIINKKLGKKGKSLAIATDAEYFANLLNINYQSKLKQPIIDKDKNLDRLFNLIPLTEEDFIPTKENFTPTEEEFTTTTTYRKKLQNNKINSQKTDNYL